MLINGGAVLKLGDGTKGALRISGAALAMVALVLMAISTTVPWGNLDVKTKVGTIPVTLNADVYEYGINYEANLNGSQMMIGGGNIPSKIADKKVFLTGLGGFQETIGFVKGTSKEKIIYMTSYTWPPPQNGTADTLITTMVKTIPWWPVGLAQDVGISVEMKNAVNVSELKVQKVSFELHRLVNGSDKYKVAYEASPGESLTKAGDKKTYWAKITVDEDLGLFWVVGKLELELRDSFGNSNKVSDGNYRELAPPPKEIKLWTMSTEKTTSIALMMAAFPLTTTSVALLAAGSALGLLGGRYPAAGRWGWRILMAGGILAVLAVIFYVLGINALIDLTGYTDWFKWGPMFYLSMAAACLSIVPGILLLIGRPPRPSGTVFDKKPEKTPIGPGKKDENAAGKRPELEGISGQELEKGQAMPAEPVPKGPDNRENAGPSEQTAPKSP